MYPMEYLFVGWSPETGPLDGVVEMEDKIAYIKNGHSLRLFIWKLHNGNSLVACALLRCFSVLMCWNSFFFDILLNLLFFSVCCLSRQLVDRPPRGVVPERKVLHPHFSLLAQYRRAYLPCPPAVGTHKCTNDFYRASGGQGIQQPGVLPISDSRPRQTDLQGGNSGYC